MQTQIKAWGNSQGVRLPKGALEDAGFSKDDILTITVSKGQIILYKEFRHKSLKERMEAYGNKLHFTEEIDYGEPVEGEVW